MCGCGKRKKLKLRKGGSARAATPLCKEIYPKLMELELELTERIKEDPKNNTLKQYKLTTKNYRRNIHRKCPSEEVIMEIETYLN